MSALFTGAWRAGDDAPLRIEAADDDELKIGFEARKRKRKRKNTRQRVAPQQECAICGVCSGAGHRARDVDI